jgi:hypothetical protein
MLMILFMLTVNVLVIAGALFVALPALAERAMRQGHQDAIREQRAHGIYI